MAKKIMASLMIAALICIMIVPANAVATFDSQSYYIAFRSNTSNGTWKSATAGNFPYTLTSANSTINGFVFLGYKTNQIIADGSVIVATVKIDNIEGITLLGAGQPTSATLFDQTGITYDEMMNIPLSQEIIASTSIQLGNSIQHTVTFKAKGYTSQNAVIGYQLGAIVETGTAITLVNCDLYESIQEAASSGTTPEEMREVLNSWGEEELIPSIGQEVGKQIEDKIPGAIKDATNEINEEYASLADEVIGEVSNLLDENISPYFENTTEIRDAIHGGVSGIFGYAGTDAVITLPAARNPLTGNSLMWNEYQIDLGMYYNRLPAILRQLISALLTLLVSIAVIREVLDTINTILIHREIIGMPDDMIKSWTRRDG